MVDEDTGGGECPVLLRYTASGSAKFALPIDAVADSVLETMLQYQILQQKFGLANHILQQTTEFAS